MGKSTAIVPFEPADYPVLAQGKELAESIRQNMGGEQVTPADLTRIRVPTGGGTSWVIPDINGEETSAKAIEGIIVHIARRRAYWADANPSGQPPQCTSGDCTHGVGDPGGICEACPFNQFGSKAKGDGSAGRGKACKEMKLFFIVRPGCVLPDVVVIPPSSIKATRKYQLLLGVPFFSVITRLTLEKVQSKDGIGYAEVRCAKAGALPPEMAKAMLAYSQQLASVFDAAAAAAEAVVEGSEEFTPQEA